jgi:hypothetical protein
VNTILEHPASLRSYNMLRLVAVRYRDAHGTASLHTLGRCRLSHPRVEEVGVAHKR